MALGKISVSMATSGLLVAPFILCRLKVAACVIWS